MHLPFQCNFYFTIRYAGTSMGSLLRYDVRKPTQLLNKTDLGIEGPVHSLKMMSKDTSYGVLLSGWSIAYIL